MPISKFIIGPGKTLLETDEIIEAIEIIDLNIIMCFIEKLEQGVQMHYQKLIL